MARKANGAAPPTEVAVQAATPGPQTITAPDAIGFFKAYQANIAPYESFAVTDNDSFVRAGLLFTGVSDYIRSVEAAFEPSKSAANKAHKSITALEGMFVDPAIAVKEHLQTQQLTWRRKLEADRQAEQRRLQAQADAEAERQRQERQAALDAEAERQRQEKLAREAEALPWEMPDTPPEPEAPAPVAELIPAPLVRLPSNVPIVPGGPSLRKRPWAGRCTDFKALVIAAGKAAEAGDLRYLEVIQVNAVRLNQLARDHQGNLGEIYAGTLGYQEETLARG